MITLRCKVRAAKRMQCGCHGDIQGAAFRIGTSSHLDFTKMAKRYGDVFSMYLGSRLVVVLNGKDAIHEALVGKNSKTFAGRPDLYTMEKSSNGGKSILHTTYCKEWKTVRKTALSAIHKYITSHDVLEQLLMRARNCMVTQLNACAGTPHDVMPDLKVATATVMLGMLFGENHDTEVVNKVLEISDDFRETVGSGLAVDFLPWLRHFPNKKVDRLFNLVDITDAVIKKLFQENEASYESGRIRNLADAFLRVAEESKSKADANDSEDESIDSTDMVQSLADLFGAGFDTSSITLYWAVAYCVKYPQIQRNIQHELDGIIGRDRLPTVDDLKHLPYTNACLYELLRISCIAPMAVPHSTLRDVNFRGFLIPKGTVVFVNLWSVLRNEKHWRNPDVFDPTRFLDDEGQLVNPKTWKTFIPFSAGRRKCVGKALAEVELPFYFANLLHQFHFSDDGLTDEHERVNLKGEDGLTLKPRSFHVMIRRR